MHPWVSPAQSCLCGGQKKQSFIVRNIGPLCSAFLAPCRGMASVYMAALDGAGTLHSSEKPLCECQRGTLSGHHCLHGPVCPAKDAPCRWESWESPSQGSAVSQDLSGWEGRKRWEDHNREGGWMGSFMVWHEEEQQKPN